MLDFSKVYPPTDSNFDRQRAIELANLIMVAYDEYEIWDEHGEQIGAPQEDGAIVGSSTDVNLENYREGLNEDYGRLEGYWQQKTPNEVINYERKRTFWYSQTSGEDAIEDIKDFLNSDVLDIWRKIPKSMDIDKKFHIPRLGMRDQVFGFIAERKLEDGTNAIFLVFRGTRENAEWFNNFRVGPLTFLENEDCGQVRNGFYRIYNKKRGNGDRETIRTTIETYFKQYPDKAKLKNTRVFITGHSLGAGLAVLAAAHLVHLDLEIKPILYTFASPRVGDTTFAQPITQLEEAYRIINSEDLIQAVPLPTTLILDDAMLKGNSSLQKFVGLARETIEEFTGGLTDMTYQHVGLSVGFTMQTGTVAGNHNLGGTYRNALRQ